MGNDHMYYLVALAVGIAALFVVISDFRGQDLKEAREQLTVCTQQVDWWRENFGAGRPE